MTIAYLDTAPCGDCGKPIDYINQPWYVIDSSGLCIPCGQARGQARGLSDDYLMS